MPQSIQPSGEFLFVRHGQTDWNARGLLQGRTDRPLDATGIEQAHACAERLAATALDAIVSSPLYRALQTAQVISGALGVPVATDDRLVERSFGNLEGHPVHQIATATNAGLDVASSTSLPPEAEPWDQVCGRVLLAVDHWRMAHPGKRVLFVGHYGVMSAICQQLCKASRPARNATPYHFVQTGQGWDFTEITGP